ncbi:MAG: DUF2321 domain-containing protein [Candidatus Bathyarchaeota archaeon]|nr:DUF2321 domain-containing protein [Candidatus Bathyarchaeota archaeon]
MISTYYRLTGKNKFIPDAPYDEFKTPIFKSDLLYSRFLYEDRAIINGAIFLAVGMFLSKELLQQYQLGYLYFYFILGGIIILMVGIWEIIQLIKVKMDLLVFSYGFYNLSKKIPELSKALEIKDWNQAKKITEDEWDLWDPILYANLFSTPVKQKSLCPKCSEIREGKTDEFCIICGTSLINRCPHCNDYLITTKKPIPVHCKKCGKKLFTSD